jgi:uncharacterized protein
MEMLQQPALPVGTQIVILAAVTGPGGAPAVPAGAVGVIVARLDERSYRIRFPDGGEVTVQREDIAVRAHLQRAGLQQDHSSLTQVSLYDYVIYRCVIGSQAYGLNEPGSDVDRWGIYVPPAELHWSLHGVPDQLEDHATQETYWEVQKFLVLALKANPNVLECLYSPLVEMATSPAQELLAMRSIFLSRLVYQTYNGYVMSQFKKLESDLRTRGTIRWKHAMHLIRLLLSGVTVLREGFVPMHVEEHRERLLAVRRGEVPWEEVDAWRLHLHRAFDAAFATTRLPERPDYERANAYLLRVRRSMVS